MKSYERPLLSDAPIDPERFTDSLAYANAVAEAEYRGVVLINPKEIGSCLQDEVILSGGINSGTPRACTITECNLSANKDALICEGFCLKHVDGVRKATTPTASPKY
jgi:hypothetical protein